MSYTMTIDAPEKVASYVERHGSRFRDELNALFVAFVTVKMQYDESAAPRRKDKRIGLMEGIWTAPSYDEDRRMDEEIESMFELEAKP